MKGIEYIRSGLNAQQLPVFEEILKEREELKAEIQRLKNEVVDTTLTEPLLKTTETVNKVLHLLINAKDEALAKCIGVMDSAIHALDPALTVQGFGPSMILQARNARKLTLAGQEDRFNRIHQAVEAVKAAYREQHPGGCRMFSQGNNCRCILCLCDQIHALLDGQE